MEQTKVEEDQQEGCAHSCCVDTHYSEEQTWREKKKPEGTHCFCASRTMMEKHPVCSRHMPTTQMHIC